MRILGGDTIVGNAFGVGAFGKGGTWQTKPPNAEAAIGVANAFGKAEGYSDVGRVYGKPSVMEKRWFYICTRSAGASVTGVYDVLKTAEH